MHDETKAVEILEDQFIRCQQANRQFYSLNTPLLPLVNPLMCIPSLYTKDKASIKKRCSLQMGKANSVSIPTSITPNVWIITSPPTAVSSGITLICPEEAPRSIIPLTPICVLWLPPACSITFQYFHLRPCYETHELTVNISLNTSNLNVINIWSPEYRIVNGWYCFCLDTIFSYRHLCYGYRIAHTSRISDILLLLFSGADLPD